MIKRIAANFVAIKVDREERPDIDQVFSKLPRPSPAPAAGAVAVQVQPQDLFAGTVLAALGLTDVSMVLYLNLVEDLRMYATFEAIRWRSSRRAISLGSLGGSSEQCPARCGLSPVW